MEPARRKRRWLPVIAPARLRLIAFVVAAALLLTLLITARYAIEVEHISRDGQAHSVSFTRGCAVLWRNGSVFDPTVSTSPRGRSTGWDTRIERQYFDQIDLPWRPYHIRTLRYQTLARHHGLVIPLWPLVVASLLFAGYAQGLVVGERRGYHGGCIKCGYDIRKLPAGARCPECGHAARRREAAVITPSTAGSAGDGSP